MPVFAVTTAKDGNWVLRIKAVREWTLWLNGRSGKAGGNTQSAKTGNNQDPA
jgi:hypothetical protein